MQYLSSREIAEKWGVSPILIRRLCRQGRISGAVCKDGVWRIPEDAVRNMRIVFKHTEEEVLPELAKTLRKQKKKKNFHGLYDYVVMEAQSRFESQIELQKLQKAAEFYQPEEYKEGLKNEDE